MKKWLILSLMFGSFTFSAHAIQNTFHFDVKSSGPDIFACNAGIKHPPHQNRSTTTAGDSQTQTNPRGEVKKDMAFAKYAWIDQFNFNVYPGGVVKAMAMHPHKYSTLFFGKSNNFFVNPYGAHTSGPFARALTKLKFKLTSEKYGAKYFVDICYYGPKKFRRGHGGGHGGGGDCEDRGQGKCQGTGVGNGEGQGQDKGYGGGSWGWTRTITNADLTMTNTYYRDYIQQSGLKVKAVMKCTKKKYGYPQVVASTYPQWQSVTSGNFKALWSNVDLGPKPPAKCVARYYFKETSEKRRGHIKHGSRARVRLEVTDPDA